jgi:hypothetical protein
MPINDSYIICFMSMQSINFNEFIWHTKGRQNPNKNFMPQIGTCWLFKEQEIPTSFLRADRLSPEYDMIHQEA